jgi:hypothetical protein
MSNSSFSSTKAASLAELRSRAAIDETDIAKYALRRWVTSVNRLYEEVRLSKYTVRKVFL